MVRQLIAGAIVAVFMASTARATPFDDAYARGDYATALTLAKALAAKGDAQAQFDVGLMYSYGKGVKQDYAEAAKWHRPAATQGHPAAQAVLGNMYSTGSGVKQDYAEALKWYRLSAAQGYAEGESMLGVLYATARRGPQDLVDAAKWYTLAAAKGHPDAQFNLARMYESGRGVAKDDGEAVKWYRAAAERGHPIAQTVLGRRYEKGTGVPQDMVQAVTWLERAAAQGHTDAFGWLAIFYVDGRGVPQDYVLAHMWFDLAIAKGDKAAVAVRDAAQKLMTAEQIAEAQRMAREWQPLKLTADLTLREASVQPEVVRAGMPYRLCFTVANTGIGASLPLRVAARGPGTSPASRQDHAGLTPGESRAGCIAFSTTPPPGQHQVVLKADSFNAVIESDEGNNERSVTLVVLPVNVPLADLTLTGVTLRPAIVRLGKPYQVCFKVANIGNGESASFRVRGGGLAVRESPYQDHASLAKGATREGCIDYPTTPPVGEYRVGITVDALSAVTELNEGNNNQTFVVKVEP
jgi:TPR repeat protein